MSNTQAEDAQTINTEEQLNELRVGAILRDNDNLPVWLSKSNGWCSANGAMNIDPEILIVDGAPLQVLYSPGPSREEVLEGVALVAADNALKEIRYTGHILVAADEIGVLLEPGDKGAIAEKIENAEVTL